MAFRLSIFKFPWRFGDPRYTVTFNSLGGTAVPSQKVLSGGLVTEPPDPTRVGYVIAIPGWYTDPMYINPWVFATDVVTANTILYAKWTKTSRNRYYPNNTIGIKASIG